MVVATNQISKPDSIKLVLKKASRRLFCGKWKILILCRRLSHLLYWKGLLVFLVWRKLPDLSYLAICPSVWKAFGSIVSSMEIWFHEKSFFILSKFLPLFCSFNFQKLNQKSTFFQMLKASKIFWEYTDWNWLHSRQKCIILKYSF